MRVLYLINYAGKAGTEKYVENLVRVLGRDLIKPYFVYNIPGELSEKMKIADIPCLQLNLSWGSALSSAKKLAEYCRENEIDVIHAQYPRENIIALMSRRYYDKPKVVFTSHLTLRLSGISGAVWRGLNRHFTPQNHSVIAVCNAGRDVLVGNGVAPDKIEVIFNGIEPTKLSAPPEDTRTDLGLSEDCFVFTTLARFAPEKGLSFLLDAIKSLKDKTSHPFCCLICGDGELFSEIEQKRNALGLSDCCKLLGFRKDVRDILLSSDAYVCSSASNEAMSFAILEAMNCGLPLVVTDVGGNRDLAETDLQCGYVLPYGDVSGFADALFQLMENESLRDSFSDAAKEKIGVYFDLHKLAYDVYYSYK